MASSNIARLGVVLGLDMAEFSANIEKAISENRKLKNEIQRHTNAAVRELNALTEATADYGREVTKVEQIQRQISHGKFASATDEMKQKLLAQAAAYDAKVASEKKSFDAGKLTMEQQQQLAFQTTDLVTQIASGQNALIALIQQGGQLKDTMGGFSNMFKVLAAQVTLFRVAAFGAASALGVLALAMYKGAEESERLRDDLILTGNYAGIAQSQFFSLADTISSKLGVAVGDAKTVLGQLVASGKFTQESMSAVGEAILRVADLSGRTADEVAKDLIPAFRGGAASVKELNEKMHFLSLEQYKQIELLSKQGKSQEVAALTAKALNDRLADSTRELGYLEAAWRAVTNWASKAWDAMLGMGRKLDAEGSLQKQIDDLTASIEAAGDPEGKLVVAMAMQRDALQKQLDDLKDARQKAAKDRQDEAKEISLYTAAGGLQKQLALDDEFLKLRTQNRYQKAILEANETQRIYLEAEQKIVLARQEMARKNRDENNVFESRNAAILAQQIVDIERTKQEQIRQLRVSSQASSYAEILRMEQDEARETTRRFSEVLDGYNQQMTAQKRSLEFDSQMLDLRMRTIGMTERQVEIEKSRLAVEREIRQIRENFSLNQDEKKSLIDRVMDQQAIREKNLAMIESIKRVEQTYDAVFGNMMNAIERFVRTGKMSFRDLARSIIQDLIMIQIRAQATALFSMLMGNVGAAFRYGTNIGSQQTSMLAAQEVGMRASGGPVNGNQPYVVGERGPELFVPRGAGTIVPNHAMASMATTNVTNYNIQAIDVKSFEDRIMGSSNAIWAANLYAQKRLPLGAGRM
jgi:phage-related minor tail protein